jgi:hypothetical protein
VLHEDTDVPFSVLGTLWGLKDTPVQDLAQRLHDFGLIKLNLPGRSIRLHDYIREYLERALPDRARVHGRLVDAWKREKQLPAGYGVRHVVHQRLPVEPGEPDRGEEAVFLFDARCGIVGGRVVFACLNELRPLIKRCAGVDEWMPVEVPAAITFDVYSPMLALPGLFRVDDTTLRHPVPYVYPDPERIEKWREAIKALGVEPASAEIAMVPKNYVKLTGKEAQQMLRLMEAIEDHDDVQHVWANFDIEEKEIEASLA